MADLPPQAPPGDPGARRSLRARLAAGPLARRIAVADLRLYRVVRSAPLGPLDPAIRAYSRGGEHAACWLLTCAAGAAVDRRRRTDWRRAAATIGGTYLLNTALKLVIRRRRPELEDLPALISTPTKLSFPSAHSSSSFAAAAVLRPLLPRVPLRAAAATMALSRVYLGVHYPSDIAAGALLGTLTGRLVASAA